MKYKHYTVALQEARHCACCNTLCYTVACTSYPQPLVTVTGDGGDGVDSDKTSSQPQPPSVPYPTPEVASKMKVHSVVINTVYT